MAGDLLPRIADERVHTARAPLAASLRSVMGCAVFLSRVQHRERRPRARDRSFRGDCQMRNDTTRDAALAMDPTVFRQLGHRLVDQLADSLASVPARPVTRGEAPSAIRAAFGLTGPLPEEGTEPGPLLEQTARLLFDHSLFNAHPRFFGYITSSPAPIGILGDFLASAVNPNVGSFILAPAATEIEAQTV